MTSPTPDQNLTVTGSGPIGAGDPISKHELRRHMRTLRQLHSAAFQWVVDHDRRWRSNLSELPVLQSGRHVGLTWPLADEVDLRGWLGATGLPLALPAAVHGHLNYRAWRSGDQVVADDCGIAAPLPTAESLGPGQLALLLVPALAIDRRGVRLGYGGGWYDRLRTDPAWRRVPALAVLPAACVCDELPADPWDVPFDGWLDQQGCHWIAADRADGGLGP